MDNSFLTWLKSAVIFGVVWGLSGCDKLNSQKSINTETDEQPTQSQSIKQENTSKPNRTLLTRAFTHPLLLNLGLFVIQNKRAYCVICMKV